MVTFSGVYIAFPRETAAVINTVFPGRDLRAASVMRVEPVRGAPKMAINRAVTLAREASGGDADLRSIIMPMRPDQPYRVSLVRPGHTEGAPMMIAQ